MSSYLHYDYKEVKMKIRNLNILFCFRCGWKWIPRKNEIRQCPKCKSAYWDIPKHIKSSIDKNETINNEEHKENKIKLLKQITKQEMNVQ